MGSRVRLQKVERPTNRSFYVNFPVALAEALEMEKGEELEWFIENKNLLLLSRIKGRPAKRIKKLIA